MENPREKNILDGIFVEAKGKSKAKDIKLDNSATVDWVGPSSQQVPTVNDLIKALSKVKDKNMPLSVIDDENEIGGTVIGVTETFVTEEDTSNGVPVGDLGFTASQVTLQVTNIWI